MTCETTLLSQLHFHELYGPAAVLVWSKPRQTRRCASYPDHLDLNSTLEKSPDLGRHLLPGLPHHPQPLQLFKCGICLETVQVWKQVCVATCSALLSQICILCMHTTYY